MMLKTRTWWCSALILATATFVTDAAYYPMNQAIPNNGQPQQPQQQPQQQVFDSQEPVTPTIAWLEYLGHIYIEVYNYERAQRCIDEMRRLSGISLADASLARLAIDGLASRMRGFRRKPPRENIVAKVKRKVEKAFKPKVNRQQAQEHAEYMQRLMAGDTGMFPQPAMPTYRDAHLQGQYYHQGTPLRPGPVSGVDMSQAAYIRRLMSCPNCAPQYTSESPLEPINNLYNHSQYQPPPPPPPKRKRYPLRDNYVYNTNQSGLKSTDAIHDLLFQARLQEANEMFADMIKTSTSPTRPIYRIELVLSLIDLDMTDPNDCVPLWEADWRLNWRDKLRIVDVYRSCRRSYHMHDVLFQSLRRLRFRPQIEARIKTIVGAPDAVSAFSRVPTKTDFYQCAACWARKRMAGESKEGFTRMQKLLLRAEHDGGLKRPQRRYFSEMLKQSYRMDRFDPRVSFFQTVFSRDLAMSMLTGSYSGLYDYDQEQGLPSPYNSLFYKHPDPDDRHHRSKLHAKYKALKNPDPVPIDRQEVLLDAFADGSPEQLANIMNEHRHALVKDLMLNNPHVTLNELLKELDRVEREQKKQYKKDKKLEKQRKKEWDKAVKEGRVTQEQVEMQERIEQEHEELLQQKDVLLQRLQSLLAEAMNQEKSISGQDQFGMSFHDFGTQPVTAHQHDLLMKKMKKAQKKLKRLYKRADSDDEKEAYRQQMEYLEQMAEARAAMQTAHEQMDALEADIRKGR